MRPLLLLLAAVLVAGCGGAETTSPPGNAPDTEASRTPVHGPGLDGDEISLDDFRGKPVLVNVWSSW